MIAALAVSAALSSQTVLARYAHKLLHEPQPKVMIFSYTVSQAGPSDIEQSHRIFRSGDLVRDELLAQDGQTLHPKITRISRYANHYQVQTLAPRLTQYALMFLRVERNGKRLEYLFRAVPLAPTGAYTVERIAINGRSFLPDWIAFRDAIGRVVGHGTIDFAPAGRYWVPAQATVAARVAGKPARERIAFGGYQFPTRLPKSTFRSPRPLPIPALPTI